MNTYEENAFKCLIWSYRNFIQRIEMYRKSNARNIRKEQDIDFEISKIVGITEIMSIQGFLSRKNKMDIYAMLLDFKTEVIRG